VSDAIRPHILNIVAEDKNSKTSQFLEEIKVIGKNAILEAHMKMIILLSCSLMQLAHYWRAFAYGAILDYFNFSL
jgi:hypothetical protein